MNSYTEKQQARKARLLERAKRKEAQASAQYHRSRQLTDGIPMGQPILVGHHSEKRHRKTLERSGQAMHKAFDLQQEAQALRSRAASVGQGGISADDPEAIEQLQARLQECMASQALMKKVNRQFARGGWEAVDGLSPKVLAVLRETMENLSYQKRPFDSYMLQNNNATIRRLKARIAELAAAKDREPETQVYDGFSYELCTDDNRVRIRFDTKPAREVCQFMRKSGFTFSRQHMAWQRQATQVGINTAKNIIEPLVALLNCP